MSKRILLIDDEELVTKSVSMLLKTSGYETSIAQSGKEALEKIKETDFNLIICDIRIPEADGIEIIKQIRSYLNKAKKKQIPEILITGYADMEKYQEAMKLKVAEHLYKPFDNAVLLEAIKKTII
ncbi:MAG: response regulator [Candidatus Omnitrophica bacterium]|nr:response regulator [Candidatus Omnitrophota bacterium]